MKPQAHPSARSKDAGFSLLELLVVLAILAGAAAVAMPNVWRRPADGGVRAAALDLAGTLRAVRAEAIRQKEVRAVVVDPAARQYWAEGSGARRRIAARIAVDATVPSRERVSLSAGRFVFYPDGSASGGNLAVSEGAARATIAVNWLTGSTEIVWSR